MGARDETVAMFCGQNREPKPRQLEWHPGCVSECIKGYATEVLTKGGGVGLLWYPLKEPFPISHDQLHLYQTRSLFFLSFLFFTKAQDFLSQT